MSKHTTIAFDDENYDGQFVRTLGASSATMADLGEAFATSRAIHQPTSDTWHDAWRSRADAVAAITDASTWPATRRSALREGLLLRSRRLGRGATNIAHAMWLRLDRREGLRLRARRPRTRIQRRVLRGTRSGSCGLGQNVWEARVYDWIADQLAATPAIPSLQ